MLSRISSGWALAAAGIVLRIAPACGVTVVSDPSGSSESSGTGAGSNASATGVTGSGMAAAGTGGGAGNAGTGGTNGVPCGELTCEHPQWCLMCQPGFPDPAMACHVDEASCDNWGQYPPLHMYCDGHEDCDSGHLCILFEGSLGTYMQCLSTADCDPKCSLSCGTITCRTVADCPACAKSCEPYAPGYPVSVCRW